MHNFPPNVSATAQEGTMEGGRRRAEVLANRTV